VLSDGLLDSCGPRSAAPSGAVRRGAPDRSFRAVPYPLPSVPQAWARRRSAALVQACSVDVTCPAGRVRLYPPAFASSGRVRRLQRRRPRAVDRRFTPAWMSRGRILRRLIYPGRGQVFSAGAHQRRPRRCSGCAASSPGPPGRAGRSRGEDLAAARRYDILARRHLAHVAAADNAGAKPVAGQYPFWPRSAGTR